ncbi:hypothetical protein FB451DRAFT_556732 [Mycena latifolia]|nr:hypothetical protein FB451DRAFT_556732 [Mycena latifolia]
MDVPDISELQAAAKSMVYDARLGLRDGGLDTLTPRIVRQALESKFNLPEGTLDSKEFRDPLKLAISEAATEDIPRPALQNKKKRKSEGMKDPKPSKNSNERPQKKPKKGAKDFKSLVRTPPSIPSIRVQISTKEMIPSSDVEEDIGAQELDNTSAEVEQLPASEDSAKVVPPNKPKKLIPPKASGSVTKPSARASTSATPEKAADSDSELSVLDDEPPKRSKKSKNAKSKDKTSKGKKTELSKDEETIKRLKSLVLACGVRRVWAKVFKDVDKPSQQIRMLKEMLTELGMSGRMSLEQAKAIKEKRELAQELEDVQAFAAAATRSKPARAQEEEEEEESEEEELPAKRKTTARRSIMDFLGDQSDDD